jgi:hypothetical protein
MKEKFQLVESDGDFIFSWWGKYDFVHNIHHIPFLLFKGHIVFVSIEFKLQKVGVIQLYLSKGRRVSFDRFLQRQRSCNNLHTQSFMVVYLYKCESEAYISPSLFQGA